MIARRLALAGAAVLLVVGCGSSDPTDDCPTSVEVSVTEGTTPSFSWSPACRAYQVSVNDVSGPVWAMGFAFGNPAKANAILPPVAFGDSLAVGDSLAPPPPLALTAGHTYTFYLFGLNAVGQSVKMGQQSFTP
jgi:hypothetical protein